MVLTLRLTDILLLLLTACGCAAAIYAIVLMRRMNETLAQWQRTAHKLDEVLPHFQRLCASSEEAARAVKGLADQGTRVVTDITEVTGQIRDAAEEGLARLHGLMGVMDAASMLVSSFKAGLAAVQACKPESGDVPNCDQGSIEEKSHEERDL
jgi:hypothetical protein